MITLAVDAMGGDAGLAITVPGAVDFLKQQSDVHLIMVGDEAAVRQALSSAARLWTALPSAMQRKSLKWMKRLNLR